MLALSFWTWSWKDRTVKASVLFVAVTEWVRVSKRRVDVFVPFADHVDD